MAKFGDDRSKDKDIDTDIDMEEMDDLFMENPGGGQKGTEGGGGRKPFMANAKMITETSKGIAEGMMSVVGEEVERNMPNVYTIKSELTDTYQDLKDVKDEIAKQLQPMMMSMENATRKILPRVEKVMPKSWYNKLKGKLDERAAERSGSARASEQQMREDTIKSELEGLFAQQVEMNRHNEFEQNKKELMDRAISSTQHKTTQHALARIYDSLRSTEIFHRQLHTAYMKKSLELQYKHLFVAQDTHNLLAKSMDAFEGYLKGIVQNTGLPDVMKTQASDYIKKSRTEKYGTMISEYLTNARKIMFNKIKNSTKELLGNLRFAAEGLEQGAESLDMVDDFAGMGGPTVNQMLMRNIVGKGAGKLLAAGPVRAFMEKISPWTKSINGDLENIKARTYMAMDKKRRQWAGSDSWFKQFVSEFLPSIQTATTGSNDLLSRSEDAAAFDRLTRQSIVEIIPGYLGKILHSIDKIRTGNEDVEATVYNLHKRRFTTASELRDDTWNDSAMFGNDYAQTDIVGKALTVIQEGTKNRSPKGNSRASTKGLEDVISRIITNHAIKQPHFKPDKLVGYLKSKKKYENDSYIQDISEGIDPKLFDKAVYAIVYSIQDKKGGFDKFFLKRFEDTIIKAAESIDSMKQRAASYAENYGLREYLSNHDDQEGLYNDDQSLNADFMAKMFSRINKKDMAGIQDYSRRKLRSDLEAKKYTRGRLAEIRSDMQQNGVGRAIVSVADKVTGKDQPKPAPIGGQPASENKGILGKVFDVVTDAGINMMTAKTAGDDGLLKDLVKAAHAAEKKDPSLRDVVDSYCKACESIIDDINDDEKKVSHIAACKMIADLETEFPEIYASITRFTGKSKHLQRIHRQMGKANTTQEPAPGVLVGDLPDEGGPKFTTVSDVADEFNKKGFKAAGSAMWKMARETVSSRGKNIGIPQNWQEVKDLKSRGFSAIMKVYDNLPESEEDWKKLGNTGRKKFTDAKQKLIDEGVKIWTTRPQDWAEFQEKTYALADKLESEGKLTQAKLLRESIAKANRVKDSKGVKSAVALGSAINHSEPVTTAKEKVSAAYDKAKTTLDAKIDEWCDKAGVDRATVTKLLKGDKEEWKRLRELAPEKYEQLKAELPGKLRKRVEQAIEAAHEGLDRAVASTKEGILNGATAAGHAYANVSAGAAAVANNFTTAAGIDGGAIAAATPEMGTAGKLTIDDELKTLFHEWKEAMTLEHNTIFEMVGEISKQLDSGITVNGVGGGAPGQVVARKRYGAFGRAGDLLKKGIVGTGKTAWKVGKWGAGIYGKAYSGLMGAAGTVVGGTLSGIRRTAGWMTNEMGLNAFVDLYVKGDKSNKPRISWKLQAHDPGIVYGEKEGDGWKPGKERVQATKDISKKGVPVFDPRTGNQLLDENDLASGLWTPQGMLPHVGRALSSAVSGAFGLYNTALKGLFGTTKIVAEGLFGTSGKKQEKYVDVYLKGHMKDGPLVTRRQQMKGNVVFQNGDVLERSSDIHEPVYDRETKQILVTEDQIKEGLVDVDGRPLGTAQGTGGREGLLGKLFGMGQNITKGIFGETGMKIIGGAAAGIGALYKGVFSMLMGGGKAVGKGIANIGARIFGFDTPNGFGKKAFDGVYSRLDRIIALMSNMRGTGGGGGGGSGGPAEGPSGGGSPEAPRSHRGRGRRGYWKNGKFVPDKNGDSYERDGIDHPGGAAAVAAAAGRKNATASVNIKASDNYKETDWSPDKDGPGGEGGDDGDSMGVMDALLWGDVAKNFLPRSVRTKLLRMKRAVGRFKTRAWKAAGNAVRHPIRTAKSAYQAAGRGVRAARNAASSAGRTMKSLQTAYKHGGASAVKKSLARKFGSKVSARTAAKLARTGKNASKLSRFARFAGRGSRLGRLLKLGGAAAGAIGAGAAMSGGASAAAETAAVSAKAAETTAKTTEAASKSGSFLSKIASKLPGKGVLSKIAGSGAGKALGAFGRGAGKVLGKAAIPLQVAMSAFDAYDGWKNAGSRLGKNEEDVTTADKAGVATSSVMNGMSFGLANWLGDKIYGEGAVDDAYATIFNDPGLALKASLGLAGPSKKEMAELDKQVAETNARAKAQKESRRQALMSIAPELGELGDAQVQKLLNKCRKDSPQFKEAMKKLPRRGGPAWWDVPEIFSLFTSWYKSDGWKEVTPGTISKKTYDKMKVEESTREMGNLPALATGEGVKAVASTTSKGEMIKIPTEPHAKFDEFKKLYNRKDRATINADVLQAYGIYFPNDADEWNEAYKELEMKAKAAPMPKPSKEEVGGKPSTTKTVKKGIKIGGEFVDGTLTAKQVAAIDIALQMGNSLDKYPPDVVKMYKDIKAGKMKPGEKVAPAEGAKPEKKGVIATALSGMAATGASTVGPVPMMTSEKTSAGKPATSKSVKKGFKIAGEYVGDSLTAKQVATIDIALQMGNKLSSYPPNVVKMYQDIKAGKLKPAESAPSEPKSDTSNKMTASEAARRKKAAVDFAGTGAIAGDKGSKIIADKAIELSHKLGLNIDTNDMYAEIAVNLTRLSKDVRSRIVEKAKKDNSFIDTTMFGAANITDLVSMTTPEAEMLIIYLYNKFASKDGKKFNVGYNGKEIETSTSGAIRTTGGSIVNSTFGADYFFAGKDKRYKGIYSDKDSAEKPWLKHLWGSPERAASDPKYRAQLEERAKQEWLKASHNPSENKGQNLAEIIKDKDFAGYTAKFGGKSEYIKYSDEYRKAMAEPWGKMVKYDTPEAIANAKAAYEYQFAANIGKGMPMSDLTKSLTLQGITDKAMSDANDAYYRDKFAKIVKPIDVSSLGNPRQGDIVKPTDLALQAGMVEKNRFDKVTAAIKQQPSATQQSMQEMTVKFDEMMKMMHPWMESVGNLSKAVGKEGLKVAGMDTLTAVTASKPAGGGGTQVINNTIIQEANEGLDLRKKQM